MSDVPSMSLTIGAATLGDLDDAAELFDAYRQFYGQAGPPTTRAARFYSSASNAARA